MAPKSQQTLGVELEFIVFYTTPGEQAPPKDENIYGPVLQCPHYSEITPPKGYVVDENNKYHIYDLESAWVRQKVADVIASAGFKSKPNMYAKKSDPDVFEYWNVVPDTSVGLPSDFAEAHKPLKHVGVEINSPVFVAGEAAFNEISTVVKAINAAFRTTVPPMCGFHVHVGRDYKPLELLPLKRIASLLWLAEDLIGTLHPGCRHGNKHCLGMRGFSNVVTYMKSEELERSSGYWEPETPEFSLGRVDKNRKKPTNYQYRRPLDVTDSDDSTLSRSFASEHFMFFKEPVHDGLPNGFEIMDGVRMIYAAKDVEEIARTTSLGDSHRGAYNFANLKSEHNGWSLRKPTIEFRGAAGSLDDSWIVLWAKICLALSGPAVVESSEDDFSQLLYECQKGYYSMNRYDVFDLLHDIGLCKEDIDAVHSRLISGRHEREPSLAFHRPDGAAGNALDKGYDEVIPEMTFGLRVLSMIELMVRPQVLRLMKAIMPSSWMGLLGLSVQKDDCSTEPQHTLMLDPTLEAEEMPEWVTTTPW
ncbi:hypothetical protein F4859DRAFT_526953 [Xylaria cf. heliscus]|nr:hypothetical protein F4859DRAFT_526953 [Xylaria cf. heliscus]